MRRGDSTTSVIIFLALMLAAIILALWLARSVRPTRYAIGTVTDDLDELRQHAANACGFENYEGPYAAQTASALLRLNSTHVCISSSAYGSCVALPCAGTDANVSLADAPTRVVVTRRAGGPLNISPG